MYTVGALLVAYSAYFADSIPRYTMAAFPLFVAFAWVLPRKVDAVVVGVMACLQGALLIAVLSVAVHPVWCPSSPRTGRPRRPGPCGPSHSVPSALARGTPADAHWRGVGSLQRVAQARWPLGQRTGKREDGRRGSRDIGPTTGEPPRRRPPRIGPFGPVVQARRRAFR